jgi:LCP family protein required for cell wall assembly
MPAKKIILLVIFTLVLLAGLWLYFHSRAGTFVSGMITDPASSLTSSNGRTNLLLLGLGGDGHVGSDLTDTMILVSLHLASRQVTLIPIPRDIWVDSLRAKVNTAYHYGEEKRAGGGQDLVKSAITEITNLPIHYLVILDFAGFVRAIDAVGGLDLNVDTSFTDNKYPIPGKESAEPESARYETLQFTAGPTHMDGTLALKFARSRHAEGEEGTDFARSRRQEKILLAFRDRVFSSSTLFNAQTLTNLKNSLNSSLISNIEDQEFGSFLKLFLSMSKDSSSPSLDLSTLFINPQDTRPYDRQWVLIPRDSWQTIHDYVAQNLAQ